MSDIVDLIAEAIWAMPSAKRVTPFASLDEKTKEKWREDARRVVGVLQERSYLPTPLDN